MISATLTGFKELNDKLLELKDVTLAAKVLARAARKAFEPVFVEAHRLAPRDTGALIEAIRLTTVKPKSGDAVVAVGIKIAGPKKFIGPKTKAQATKLSPKSMWHFVEFGTSKMAAKPFLRPALEKHADLVTELLKAELAKGIERAVRRQAKARGK